jgi:hypothetical protein
MHAYTCKHMHTYRQSQTVQEREGSWTQMYTDAHTTHTHTHTHTHVHTQTKHAQKYDHMIEDREPRV